MLPCLVILVVLVLCVSGPFARSQTGDCTIVKNDQERLACFDALARQGPLAVERKAPGAIDPIIAKARAAVARSLDDPPSARFDGVVRKSEAVCGLVNAKTSPGGYFGKIRFAYVINTGCDYSGCAC